ncbi:hypothetical protein N9B72_01510 [Bacteriovoracaceae bacterium]|nr:hypothetical protein [Bacteriovoracaceae bacterium]
MTIIGSTASIPEFLGLTNSVDILSDSNEQTPHNSSHQKHEEQEESEKTEKREKVEVYSTHEARFKKNDRTHQVLNSFMTLQQFICDGFLRQLYRPPAIS